MNPFRTSATQRSRVDLITALAVVLVASSAPGQPPHLSITTPGGMPGWPVITDIAPAASNQVDIVWDGPPGFYRLLSKGNLVGGSWQPVGSPTNSRTMRIPATATQAFFRVLGPSPVYAGAASCLECHAGAHAQWSMTPHSKAFDKLKQIGQQNNASCLPCHTVGFGLPTGFTNEVSTPRLAGVQCENCHGPSGMHAANPSDFTVKPRVEIAATMCGGCHSGKEQPTYEEWKGSGHSIVSLDMNPANRIESCGRCHSGTSRLAQLGGVTGTNLLARIGGDANMPISCVVCHDSHRVHVRTHLLTGLMTTNQLLYPVYSTNDYVVTTTGTLLGQHDPNINLCAQCHNHRGATWTGTRAPHYSPQYNVMLGTVGELEPGTARRGGRHGREITDQCVTCHMQSDRHPSMEDPVLTGHSFAVTSYDSCRECHPFPAEITALTRLAVATQIQNLKWLLDTWGATAAPDVLRTNYGSRSWEYNPPGSLTSGSTPTNTQQEEIPDPIRKARFNLYLMYYDGSYGAHNGPYAVQLLEQAAVWVEAELRNAPPP